MSVSTLSFCNLDTENQVIYLLNCVSRDQLEKHASINAEQIHFTRKKKKKIERINIVVAVFQGHNNRKIFISLLFFCHFVTNVYRKLGFMHHVIAIANVKFLIHIHS